MIKIGITGQGGFIGTHLWNYLFLQEGITLVEFQRSYFNDIELLDSFVKQCDTIVHLAGLNRHEDPSEIYKINTGLAQNLVNSFDRTKRKPHIIFSSSSQESNESSYGKSKKEASAILKEWSDRTKAVCTTLIIPNVFGPFGKPFYNSVIATFCYQVVNGQSPKIIEDNIVNLIYVNDLISEIYELALKPRGGKLVIPHTYEVRVSDILSKLKLFRKEYLWKGEFPNLQCSFDLKLYNTFRCYISHDYYPRPFIKHTDDRGYFVEIVRANTPGQFSFSTTKPGITRGNHFHTRKAERFAVIKGKAKIQLRKVGTRDIVEYIIDGSNPAYVDMPIWYTHNIANIGDDELIALFWINEPYNEKDPDTHYINV